MSQVETSRVYDQATLAGAEAIWKEVGLAIQAQITLVERSKLEGEAKAIDDSLENLLGYIRYAQFLNSKAGTQVRIEEA